MITLLIPTMNRSDFVVRLIQYYAKNNFKHSILIGDSSDSIELNKTKDAVNNLKSQLNIQHFDYPNLNNFGVMYELIKKVKTPYSTFLPDDDFFVVNSIEKLLSFMDKNPEYSCAWGKTVIFQLLQNGAYGKMKNLFSNNEATSFSFMENTAEERLVSHFNNYTSIHTGICRTNYLEKALRHSMKMNLTTPNKNQKSWWTSEQFGEITTSYSLAIQGKIKSLDCLFWVRQHHDQRYGFNNFYDWLTSPNWLECFNIQISQLTEDLMKKEGLNEQQASKIIKRILLRGIYERMGDDSEIIKKNNIDKKVYFTDLIKRIPFAKKGFKFLRKYFAKTTGSKGELSLTALLDKSSPYHEDFIPIYDIVTNSSFNK